MVSDLGCPLGSQSCRRYRPARTAGAFLGRPTVDKISGSRFHNMRELRPAATIIRILFVFDPQRQAVLLLGGDKAGDWKDWYDKNIPIAEQRYEDWLRGFR